MSLSAFYLIAKVASASAKDFSASASFLRLGSTINKAWYVSTHALTHKDKFPAG